jgi:MSHA biogenesis protein MshK
VVERLIAAALLAAPALPGYALAQAGLSDPTRPPALAPTAAGVAGSAQATAAPPRLQSVLLSPHRRVAVIDGRTVELGGEVGGAMLVQIAETHVTLRSGSELKILELQPRAVRMSPVRGDVKEKNKEKP